MLCCKEHVLIRRLAPIAFWCTAASCYHLPIWSGKVTVTAMERASIAKCGTGALTSRGATYISRQPYVQSTTTTSTIVVWGSTEDKGQVVLREPAGDVVATAVAEYAGDADRRAARLAAQHREGKELDADDIYLVAARFDKLQPGHLYCYQLVAGDAPLTEPAPLATAAPPGTDSLRFVALGDSGTGGAAQLAIAKRLSAVTFELILFLGDLAYEDGSPRQLQSNFFAVYRDVMRYTPAYPTIGNHERQTRSGRPYFEAFVLPEPERYYSFDWGDVHFVAIDTTQRDARQLVWLEDDLTNNKLPWVIVYGHHPMYTNSLRGAQQWIRAAFANIVTRHKVDIVLAGHEHQYERFRVAGVNYIVSGGGGGQLTRFFGRSRALKQATVHHFLSFEVTAKALDMKVIDISGNAIETLHLTKQGDGVKVKVNDKPDEKSNLVPPENQIVPDEKIHREPDDDTQRQKVDPAKPPPEPTKSTPLAASPGGDQPPATSSPPAAAPPAAPPR
ncbi:MAG TPA: metallophosphoesterase [Kofleriaceae bacterium]|nr:metallophosphoesterase [Kofleriaceae bacterium]